MLLNLTVIAIGYILGSIPTAYLIARLRKGIDIRNVGVGNVGAANVFWQIGYWDGVIVWIIDMAKGAAPIFIAQALSVAQPWVLGAGFAALLGHNFPVFLKFKGGKGSSTAIGIFLALAPVEMSIALVIIAIPLFITHHFAFSLAIGFIFLPLLIWLFQDSMMLVFYSLALIFFIGLRSLPHSGKFWTEITKKHDKSPGHDNSN